MRAADKLEPVPPDQDPASAQSKRIWNLASALAKGSDAERPIPGSVQFSQVKKWSDGEYAISAEKAFLVGEILRTSGHPYASGLLAVIAAGHFAEYVRTLRVLALYPSNILAPQGAVNYPKPGISVASLVARVMPLVAEVDILSGVLSSPHLVDSEHALDQAAKTLSDEELKPRIKEARLILAGEGKIPAPAAKLVRQAWQNRAKTKGFSANAAWRRYVDIDSLDTAIDILSLRRPLNKLWKAAAEILAEWGLRAEGTPYFFETDKYSSSGAIPRPPFHDNKELQALRKLVDLNEWIFSLRETQAAGPRRWRETDPRETR